MRKFRTLIRIIADNDWEHGDPYAKSKTVLRPVAVISSWNFRRPVMLTSWPPGFEKFEDLAKDKDGWDGAHWCGHALVDRDDLNDDGSRWEFDVEWVS